VRIPVELSLQDRAYPGELVDLSLTGAFVETHAALAPGLRAELRVRIPGGEPLRVGVRVVRHGAGARHVPHPSFDHLSVRVVGLALSFEDLNEPTAGHLRALIALIAEADL
jgi:hypothetical protein